MIAKFIRLIIAVVICALSVVLFVKGFIGWGILAVFIAGLFVLFHFKNENNLLAFLFIRRNKIAAVDSILSRVKHPERMIKTQEAYFYYLRALVESQQNKINQAEKSFKKSLSTGLRMKNDQAVAKLNLSGIYLSKRNKKLSKYYLQEAKKLDTQKLLKEQIKEVEHMMKRI